MYSLMISYGVLGFKYFPTLTYITLKIIIIIID